MLVTDAYELIPSAGGSHQHFFGGSPQFVDPTRLDGCAPLHLLFDLDLSDPALSFLGLSHARRLPLVHPFRYDGGQLAYEIINGSQVAPLLTKCWNFLRCSQLDDWPYAKYPNQFERIPIALRPVDAGCTLVSEPKSPAVIFRPLVSGDHKPLNAIAFEDPPNYPQPGEDPCAKPGCKNADWCGGTTPFASIPCFPVPHVDLWGECGSYVWVVFCICPECKTITTFNVTD